MVNWLRGGCIALFAPLLLQAAGAVGAAPPSPSVVKDTGRYLITLSLKDVAIQTVPNMAGAPFVREGFITATSKLDVVCRDDTTKIKCEGDDMQPIAKLSMSAQVGCPVDVSSGVTNGLNPEFTSSLPLQGILQAILPPPTPAPTPGSNDVTDIAILPNGQITPSVGLRPKPGYIRDVPLGEAPASEVPDVNMEVRKLSDKIQRLSEQIENPPAKRPDNPASNPSKIPDRPGPKIPLEISVQNLHLEVDQTENELGSCGGTVTVRISAHADVKTADSADTVDIYGDIYVL